MVGSDSSMELTLTNMSAWPASFKLLTASKLPTTIDKPNESSVADANLHINCQKQASDEEPFPNCQEKSDSNLTETSHPEVKTSTDFRLLEDYKNGPKSCPEFRFFPSEGTVSAKGSMGVKVIFNPVTCGESKWAIVCEVAGGKSSSQYAIAHTLAAASEIYLSPSSIDLGVTYLGLSIQKTVSVHNLSVVPCYFNWSEEVFRSFSFLTIEVEPVKGLLAPHGKQEIQFSLTPKEPGEKECSVVCQALGMMHSLQLRFRLYVSDISFRFHVERPLKPNRIDYSKTEYMKSKLSDSKSIDRSKLPTLNFGKRCPLGVVQSLRVIVQNETAVAGKVHASVANYGLAPALLEEQINELTGRHVEANSKGARILDDCRQFANHQFWTESGCIRSLQRQWASTCIKGGDQGLSIVLSSSEGTLQGWESWHCDVFCYACMPRTYNDILHIMVGDITKCKIPISIGVIGTPLSMRENRFEPQDFGRTGHKKWMVLKWGSAPAGFPLISKIFWVLNSGPYNLELEWELYDPLISTEDCAIKAELNVEEDEQHVHIVMLGDPDKGPIQLKLEIEDLVSIRVELMEYVQKSMRESLFKIHPAKQVVVSLKQL